MKDFSKTLELLIALQEKDSQIDQLKRKAEDIPLRIEEQNSFLKGKKDELETLKKSSTRLLVDRKNKEIELQTKENEINKHNTELNKIKTNEAYKALLTSIENCKENKANLENEILEIFDKIEIETAKAKEAENVFKAEEEKIKSSISSLQSELNSVKTEIDKLSTERNEFAKQLPENILQKYDFIRESREGFAVVPVVGENCGGCQISLRNKIINELCKSQDFVCCESCSRILYKK